MKELAYVNGVFSPIAEAVVPIEDRGFQFGDGVYEVIVTYNGRLFQLAAHLERLRRSLAAIELDYDFERDPLEPIIEEGLRRSGLRDAMVYIQITRGVSARSHAVPAGMTPTVVMTFKPRPVVPAGLRERGASINTVTDSRWANCYVKAITLLPNVLAKTDAVRRGYDDAVFVTPAGEVRECTSANIFIVVDGKVIMPPRNESVLHGITQRFVLDTAASIGIAVEEHTFDVGALQAADEAFMSSTTVEVLGVTRVDDRPIGDGRVGPVTGRLLEAFHARLRDAGDAPTTHRMAM